MSERLALVPTLALFVGLAAAAEVTPMAAPDPNQKPNEGQILVVTADAEVAPTFGTSEVSSLGGAVPISETPATVNVLSQDFWQQSGARQLETVLPYIPGVNQTDNGGGKGDAIAIRGFSATNLFVDGRKNIGIYGTPLSTMPDNVERIEIVKGPAGAEFGVGDPGGTVNLVTKKPHRETAGMGTVTIGEDGFRRFSGDVTGGIATNDAVQARLIVAYEEPPEWRNGRPDNTNNYLIAPSVNWDYSDTGSVLLQYSRTVEDGPQDRGVIYLEGAFDGGFAPREWSFHQTTSQALDAVDRLTISNKQRWSDGLTTKVAAEYQEHLFQLREFRNAGSEPGGVLYNPDGITWTGVSEIPLRWSDWHVDTAALSGYGEVEWAIDTAREHVVTGGARGIQTEANGRYVDYTISNTYDIFDGDNNQVPEITSYDGTYTDDTEINEHGVYARWNAAWTKSFRTLAAVTYTAYDYSYDGFFNGVADFSDSYDSDTVSWRSGASYDVIASQTIFVGVSDSYAPQGGLLRGGGEVEPIHDQAVEIGLKSQLFDRTVLWTNSVYYQKRDNITASDPTNVDAESFLINAGEAEIYGIESEAVGRLGSWWTIRGGVALTASEITNNPDNPQFEGNRFANTPKYQASLFATYQWGGFGLEPLRTSLGAQYMGNRYGNSGNTIVLPEYILLDFSAGWDFHQGSVLSLHITNLLDETYYTGMQDGNGAGADQVMVGQKRNISLSFSQSF